MGADNWTGDVSVLGIDVIGYTGFSERDQARIVEVVDRLLRKAADVAQAQILDQRWIDAGDGGYHLVQGHYRAALTVLERFVKLLADENADRRDDKTVRCRYAIHCGPVRRSDGAMGPKYVGDGINNCARLLAGMSRDYVGQAVCSGDYQGRLTGFCDEPEEMFQRLEDIVDKHGKVHEVWNIRAPGLGVDPQAEHLHRPG